MKTKQPISKSGHIHGTTMASTGLPWNLLHMIEQCHPLLLCVLFQPVMILSAGAQSLLYDGFEYGVPGGGLAIANPFPNDPLDNSTTSMQVGSSNTVVINFANITPSSGHGLDLTMQADMANVGPYCVFRGALFSANIGGGTNNGYGFEITPTNVKILKYQSMPLWQASPEILASNSISSINTTSWNEIGFYWETSGELTLTLNGSIVSTALDNQFAPGVIATDGVGIWSWNNNANLTFDNIQLVELPTEPTVLFTDQFETNGVLSGGAIVNNPFPVDPRNRSAKCMNMTATGTTQFSVSGITPSSGTNIQLALQLNTATAGTSYSLRAALFSETIGGGTNSGYGMAITPASVSIVKYSTNALWQTPASLVTVPTSAILTNGWNNFVFTWTTNGELSVSLNGCIISVATNHQFSPGVLASGGLGIWEWNVNTNLALDNLEVTAVSGVPAGAAALGYTECIINESPVATDLYVGTNPNFAWYSRTNTYWTTSGPQGTLALPLGSSVTGYPISAPLHFSLTNGALPLLTGSNGFYLDYVASFSSNSADMFPGFYCDAGEHLCWRYDNDFQYLPGDATNYERWMELDVDESYTNKFGEVTTSSTVISWSGTNWSGTNYYIPIQDQQTYSNAINRTLWHTYAAAYNPLTNSFNPTNGSVKWYLDGSNIFSANKFVSTVAPKQHFVIVLDCASHSKTTPYPYTMYVGSVHAYQPPDPVW